MMFNIFGQAAIYIYFEFPAAAFQLQFGVGLGLKSNAIEAPKTDWIEPGPGEFNKFRGPFVSVKSSEEIRAIDFWQLLLLSCILQAAFRISPCPSFAQLNIVCAKICCHNLCNKFCAAAAAAAAVCGVAWPGLSLCVCV